MEKSKRQRIVLVLCGFLLVFSTGIAVALQNGWGFRPTSKSFKSQIDENSHKQPFTSHVSTVNTADSLDFIQFLSGQVGWGGSHTGILYRTNDGGNKWERLESKLEGYVGSMYFSSDLSGWVILQRYERNLDKTQDQGWVMHTDDGGRSWQPQFTAKSLELVRMNFTSPNEGWVIGTRFFKKRDALRSEFFLLHTIDSGKNWIDVSRELNTSMADFWGSVWEWPSDIVATKPRALTLLTESGYTITTANAGVRWQNFGRPDTQGLEAQRLVPRTQDLPRILAGMGGNHGIASMLSLRQNDGSWTSTVINRVFLKDALYVSDKELIACGSMLSENNQPLELSGEGVVLHSRDDGMNWTIVYRSADVRSLNALARSDVGRIWAVGSNGTMVMLEKDIISN